MPRFKFDLIEGVRFDWLTWSTPGDETKTFERKGIEVKALLMNKGDGLKYWYTLSGDTIYPYFRSDDFATVSRLDVKVDVLLGSKPIKQIFNRSIVPNLLKFNKIYESATGKCIYYGKGDKLLRIYEKGKQLGFSSYSNWIRFEFQLKGREARHYLHSFSSPEEIFASLQTKYLNGCFGLKELTLSQFTKAPVKEDLYVKNFTKCIEKQPERATDELLAVLLKAKKEQGGDLARIVELLS